MQGEKAVTPFLGVLSDLVSWFDASGVRGIIIGGLAASLLGRPRVTRDVDALVLLEEQGWKHFLVAGRRFGFAPRRSDALDFAREARVLLVRHSPTAIDVDVVFGALPFEEEAITRAVSIDLGPVNLPLPSVEDLLIMKAVAHRPRDIADMESLLDVHSDLDLKRVRYWVREFSSALESPEILEELETILSQGKKPRKGQTSEDRGS